MIHFVIGTRAQLIKTAPVMYEYNRRGIDYNFIFLAQHKVTMYEMMDMFDIKRPDFVIGDIGKDVTSVSEMIPWSIKTLWELIIHRQKYFRGDKEGVVFVHGDAPPVLLGALGAKLSGLKVALIESGMRSFNWFHPFPEEITRVFVWAAGLVDYHFCAGESSYNNVARFRGTPYNVGLNTMYDAQRLALRFQDRATVDIPGEKYALVTIHRFETISKLEQLKYITDLIDEISKEIRLLFILHPPTEVALKQFGLYKTLELNSNIELRPRYLFFDFNKLMYHSEFIITDGGSNQEEAYYMGKPCCLFRMATEREEGLGENAVLSELNRAVIMEFVHNYSSYKRNPLNSSMSPTAKIIDIIDDDFHSSK